MSVSTIDEEVEDFKLELGWKDTVASVTNDIATLIMKGFWLSADSIYLFRARHSARYGQNTTSLQEGIRRVANFIFAVAVGQVTLAFYVFATPFLTLFSRSYRTTAGTFEGEVTGQRLFILNPQMGPGPLPSYRTGLVSGGERLDRLATTIRDNDPDIVFLPGVHSIYAGDLASKLKDRYHFIFSAMGPKCFDFDAGFFVAFRGELVRTPEYIPFNHQKGGYFTFETPDTLYLCTQNPSLESLQEMCSREGKKVVLMGDLGFEPDSPEYAFLVEKGFGSAVNGVTETNVPYLDFHKKDEPPTERKNSVLFVKGEHRESKVLRMYKGEGFIDQALSNHNAVLA
ncbi:hypothetical protein [Candidatus Neptunochlamydia vexilliferae]|uniref:Uncharacterized protein n=1 Tax=Candidatus Neptunichlamydia vexilliferae TaxID=1651774 RepID=A0ABS0B274_9BACT|nr:hypothetical protein [Candidatus Neptunochlamydia vexilliferae]MBF5059977.1 hypothetical protein [Candidatus Neptunochlamydia vexilliferae]